MYYTVFSRSLSLSLSLSLYNMYVCIFTDIFTIIVL